MLFINSEKIALYFYTATELANRRIDTAAELASRRIYTATELAIEEFIREWGCAEDLQYKRTGIKRGEKRLV